MKSVLRIMLIAFGVIVLTTLGVFAYSRVRRGVFMLARVEVSGTETVAAQEVVSLSQLDTSMSVLTANLRHVASNIERDPLLVVEEVTRQFPDTIVVEVRERTPVALMKNGSRLFEASADGYIIRSRVLTQYSLPVLSDFPVGENEQRIERADVREMLALLGVLYEQGNPFYELISEIRYTDDELVLYPRNFAVTVLLEHGFDSEKIPRLHATLIHLKQTGARVSLVDYRFDKPTIVQQ